MLEAVPNAADLRHMGDERIERGAEIRRRREALGLSVRAFAKVSGKSREAIGTAEAGTASLSTYVALERCLADVENDDFGEDQPSALAEHESTVKLDVTGPTTAWHVEFTGPMADAEELLRQIRDLMRETGLGEPNGD